MPVNEWPTDDVSPRGWTADELAAARAAIREATHLLDELHDSTTKLGDALAGAGFAPSAWRSPDALLAELGDDLPEVTVDELLARLAEFAASSGPAWLAGDGAALDDFEHEVLVLAGVMRPLRVLAQRQRLTLPTERGWHPLDRALGDGRVGAQLDRLARTLRLLEELAPALEPVPPEPTPAWDVPAMAVSGVALPEHDPSTMAAGETLIPPGADEPDGLSALADVETAGPTPRARMGRIWPDSWSLGRAWARLPWRSRMAALGMAAGLVLLAVSVSGMLALTHARRTGPQVSTDATELARTGKMVTSTAARSRTARAATPTTATTAPTMATATPTQVPARLAVSPSSVTLTCGGGGVTLTLSDTGGQALSWRASVPSNVILSATSGWLGAHSSSTITARASGSQHGPGTIVFTADANGGTATVSDKVTCH